MSASLYMLRDFFKAGRNHHGGYMGEHEDLINATERNLSLYTDEELLALRDSARLFMDYCERTRAERDMDAPEDDDPDDTPEP
jgi:hypothetical protein